MTRYLCSDVSHVRDGELHPVDVTAQVRLERELLPRPMVYVATTESVVDRVGELDLFGPDGGREEIRRILTGTAAPMDLPVVVTSERALLFHAPGLHEVDELRRSEPAIDRLLPPREPGHEVVVLDDRGGTEPDREAATQPMGRPEAARGEATTQTVPTTRTATATEVGPQGAYDLWDLSERLAGAIGSRGRAADVLRDAPRTSLAVGAPADAPWRVVITCPQPEGNPPMHHDTVFTGTGAEEAVIVQGTRPDGLDAVLERDANRDLGPAAELARTERRLATLVIGEVVVTLLLLGGAWLTGALATAARETPGWLAFGLTLILAGIAFGGIALAGPKDPAGNVNDIYTVRNFYSSRMQLLQIAMGVSAGLAALGLLAAVVPPALAAEQARPAATISFESTDAGVIATVDARVDGLPSGTEVRLVSRSYDTAASDGRIVGTSMATSDGEGIVTFHDELALSSLAGYLAADLQIAGQEIGTCAPLAVTDPGCTVVTIPRAIDQGGTGGTTIVVPVTTLPSAVPEASPAPSPVVSVTTAPPTATTTTTTTPAP
jgi:hypothetical protein